VSANAGNLAKLGTDNRVLVLSTDLDARYVNTAGDTMTGALSINYAAAQLIVGGTGNTTQTLRSTDGGNAALNISSGANTGQLVQTGTSFNFVNYAAGGNTSFSQAGNGQIRFFTNSTQVMTVSGTGVGVTGNITSTGTAHSFAANSITASAISGLPAASAVAGAALTATGVVGVSTAYARADHSHPLPTLKADDLTDVAVATPATGQVLRYNGTNFVNAKLNFSDLSGTQVNPTINTPSMLRVFRLPTGQTEAFRDCVVLATAPVASTTITGVQGQQTFSGQQFLSTIRVLTLGKVNTVTGVFTGGVATYSGWVAMALGVNERHACVFAVQSGIVTQEDYRVRYYTATENSEWSTAARGTDFTPQNISGRFVRLTSNFTFNSGQVDGTIANVSDTTAPVIITIPSDAQANIPIGTRVEILDLSNTAVTEVYPDNAVTLRWNLNMSGGSPANVGVGRLTLPGAISRIEIIKTNPNEWYAFN
jgi:hypothetical protein